MFKNQKIIDDHYQLSKVGVLLVNLGTPDRPDVPFVRRYLKEFLSDPRVIDLPFPLRWLLLNAVILPFRSKRSSQAYQKIWTAEGSPLLINSEAFAQALATRLGDAYHVALGMRYGNPSISSALLQLRDCAHIKVLPLFPQYSSAATGSAIEKVLSVIAQQRDIPNLSVIHDFYDHPAFISAYARLIQETLKEKKPDTLLFSYHGLPERHVRRSKEVCIPTEDRGNGEKVEIKQRFGFYQREHAVNTSLWALRKHPCFRRFADDITRIFAMRVHRSKYESCGAVCDMRHACPDIRSDNARCYRAQCYQTSRLLAQALGLSENDYHVAFQSRLGKMPWIQPYTDQMLATLAKTGVKHIAIACPSFVADCLETLEEIGLRARQAWLALGGEELTLIPSLNVQDDWVAAVVEILASF